MRPGLVTVGVLLAILAAGMLLVVNLAPSTSQNRDWFTLPPQPLRANATTAVLIQGTATADGTLTLHWSATVGAKVALYRAPGCAVATPACAVGPPLVAWASNLSGVWSAQGALAFPYLLDWVSAGNATGAFSADALEESPGAPSLASFGSLLIDGGAAVLGVIAAVALFLGLFLRGGVYGEAPPIVSRSADDAAEIARGPRPPP